MTPEEIAERLKDKSTWNDGWMTRNCEPATFRDLWLLWACAAVLVVGSVVLWLTT